MKIDKIDAQILRTLQRDARSNFSDIAKNCGVSVDTIVKRFNKMRKIGIIRGTTVLLNPKKFGYNHIASFGIDIDYSHLKSAISFLQDIPEIIFHALCLGRYDLFAIGFFKDIERLGEVKDLIKSHPFSRNITTSIWTGQILLCPENFEF